MCILNYANWISHIIINDKNLEVVTIRVLAFLSGCNLALLKAVCNVPKKELDVNIRNLLLGTRLQIKGPQIKGPQKFSPIQY